MKIVGSGLSMRAVNIDEEARRTRAVAQIIMYLVTLHHPFLAGDATGRLTDCFFAGVHGYTWLHGDFTHAELGVSCT